MAVNEFVYFDLPCTEPERMDDWFIDEHPKLEDSEILAIQEQVELGRTMANSLGKTYRDPVTFDDVEEIVDKIIAARIKDLKTRRRHAIQSCYLDCPARARLLCLDKGLQPGNQEYGIFGAYPESERRAIVQSLANRKRSMPTSEAAAVIISAERAEALNLDE